MLKKRPMVIFVIVASLAVALIVFLANLGTELKTAASLSAFTGGLLFLVGFAGRWMFWRDEGDDDWEEDKE